MNLDISNLTNEFNTQTFDLITALANMFFWVIFAYTTPLLNCDLQRLMTNNIYFKHVMGMCGFFYLMSIVDKNNSASLGITWLKAIGGYIIFMLLIKGNLYTILSIIGLLVIDQSLLYHINYKKNINKLKNIKLYESLREYIKYIIVIVGIIGLFLYYIHATEDHTKEFSIIKFIIGSNFCKI